MSESLRKDLARLATLTTSQLQEEYRHLFGEPARSFNRQWLYRRCAWRMQALAEGDLAERARRVRQRALTIADDADVRVISPRRPVPDATLPRRVSPVRIKKDDRLPIARTVLTRPFKGKVYEVTVLPDGFEYNGIIYKSLSAVAHAITGTRARVTQIINLLNLLRNFRRQSCICLPRRMVVIRYARP